MYEKKLLLGYQNLENSKNTDDRGDELIEINLNENNFIKEYKNFSFKEAELFKVEKIYLTEGDFFLKNQLALIIKSRYNSFNSYIFKTNFAGKVIEIQRKDDLNLDDYVLTLLKYNNINFVKSQILNQSKNQLQDFLLVKEYDDFEDKWTIEFRRFLSQDTAYIKIYDTNSTYSWNYLGITFKNHNGYSYIEFISTMDELTLSSKDEIIILFEDTQKIRIQFPYAGSGRKGNRTNTYPLDSDFLRMFLTKKILKIKVISYRKQLYTVCAFNQVENIYGIYYEIQYSNSFIAQEAMKFMTYKFIVANITNNNYGRI